MLVLKPCTPFLIKRLNNNCISNKHLLILTALLLSLGSYHPAIASQSVTIDMRKPMSAAQLAEYNRDGIVIDYDNTPVLKHVYVTAKDGAIARQLPSGAAKKIKDYRIGTKLDVIEDNQQWYGIRDSIFRQYDEDYDGQDRMQIEVVRWEKVYIKKDQTGSLDSIALTPKDLNVVSHLSVGKKDESFETGKALNDYLKIELIDKALFEKKRPLAVDFLSHKNAIKKRNGVISIQLAKDSLTLVDNNLEEDTENYRYIGRIDDLDQHLVAVRYWESQGYRMIDQVEGHLTQEFLDYPYISPNKKYIISAYANPYEQQTELGLYKIDGREVKPIISADFQNWMPTMESADIFWASDGYLYLAVTHSAAYWQEDGNLNNRSQYIRIKVVDGVATQ